jgi:phospholipid/cholesterol/gamma-HCH transport system substrate-binding protein
VKRAIREHSRDFIAILALVVFALASVGVILVEQRFTLPSWVPGIGSDRFELKAQISSGQAITPGQGQTVDIAGIKVGDISGVDLQSGVAVVTMQIEQRYAPLIHRDASILVRPRTGLADQTIELDPGKPAKPQIEEGTTIPLANTLPNVQPDELLASLDGDTQGFLKLLLISGGQGLGGNGRKLSSDLRRLDPTARDLAKINVLLAKRRTETAHVIHDFGLVSKELAGHDRDLANFVSSSDSALGDFAQQEASIRAALQQFPSALGATRSALVSSDQLSKTLRPALIRLLPQARALKPALEATQPFFRNTKAPIRDQIRPFTRKVAPTIHHLGQGAKPLGRSTTALAGAFTDLNKLLNALAYDPAGSQEPYLFWLSWLNHNGNSTLSAQDANGPAARALIVLTCATAISAESVTQTRPFLNTIRQLTNPPSHATIDAKGGCV